MVAIKQNKAGNFNFGMQMPDIRQGDELQAGMNVADLLDLSEMNLSAKVGEMDRANLKEGQEMTFQLDSVPDKRFPGKIKTLSGTASADVFSGDPSKKFDVTFTIDMRALLSGLGMKAAEVDKIMNEAAQNASKNLVSMAPTMGGGRGGPGGPPGMDFGAAMDPTVMAAMRAQQGGQGGQPAQGGAQAGGRQGAGGATGAQGGGRNAGPPALSAADAQKLAQIGKQLLTATGAEHDRLEAEMQALMPQQQRGRGGQGRGQGGGGFGGGQGGFGGGPGGGQGGGAMAGGQGRGQGGQGGGPGGPGGGPGGFGGQGRPGASGGAFTPTVADLANAKLPVPPDQDTEVSLLLRPGLLADVEIEVEKIPNALHVPQQAVFQKGGQALVYVMQANGRFAPRVVKVAKESESTMVLDSGVEPGEMVALQDPTASKSEKGKTDETKKASSATSMMPGGK